MDSRATKRFQYYPWRTLPLEQIAAVPRVSRHMRHAIFVTKRHFHSCGSGCRAPSIAGPSGCNHPARGNVQRGFITQSYPGCPMKPMCQTSPTWLRKSRGLMTIIDCVMLVKPSLLPTREPTYHSAPAASSVRSVTLSKVCIVTSTVPIPPLSTSLRLSLHPSIPPSLPSLHLGRCHGESWCA